MEKFKGQGVALVTPFDNQKNVDYTALEKLVLHQINNGTDYLVVQGTTGESATLSFEEKQAVLDFVMKVNAGRLPIVLGVGGNNTIHVVETYKKFNLKGVDGILSVSPYYNKPNQEGIYQHYKYIAAHIDLPIILYNVPGRTGSNMLPSTTLRLAKDFSNIVAVKEASGNMEQIMEIIQNKPKDFLVISGDDALTLPIMSVGGDGVISVVANAFPKEFRAVVHHQSIENHYKLFPIIQQLFADGNPGGIKEALQQIGICSDDMRMPLYPVNSNVKSALKQLIEKL